MAFYALALHRRVSFRTARVFLLAGIVLSAVIPALDIPVWKSAPVGIPVQPADMSLYRDYESTAPHGTRPAIDYRWAAVVAVYVLGAAGMLTAVAFQFAKIGRIRRRAQISRADGYKIAVSDDVGPPFSFLSTVFVGRGTSPAELRQILLHEESHIRHRHSTEKIIMELLKALLWFNPFAWIASRRLNEIHEFEADRDALQGGCTMDEYLPLIFRQVFGYTPEISTGLGNSLTKKRFEMMTKNFKHRRYSWLRTAGVLPAAAALMMLFGFTHRAPEIIVTGQETASGQYPKAGAAKPEQGDIIEEKVDEATGEIIAVRQTGDKYTVTATGRNIDQMALSASVSQDSTLKVRINKGGKGVPPLVWLENEGHEIDTLGRIPAGRIQSVSVIKDASQCPQEILDAMGDREFNGVIMIKLKEPEEPMKITVDDQYGRSYSGTGAGLTNSNEQKQLSHITVDKSSGGEDIVTVTVNHSVDSIHINGAASADRKQFIWVSGKNSRELSEDDLKALNPEKVLSISVLKERPYPAEVEEALDGREVDGVIIIVPNNLESSEIH